MRQCLWCGNSYEQGMDGVCRSCWEENQFPKEQAEPAQELGNESDNF